MGSASLVTLTILNVLISALFGLYSSYSFSKQSHTRDPEVSASFFRLSDYVRTRSLDAYRKAYALLIALAVFCPLEVLANSPRVADLANAYLLKRLLELAGNETGEIIKAVNEAVPHFVLPVLTGILGLCILFPQVKFCLSKCRNAIHRMVDFTGNAQTLIDDVYVQLPLSQREIEKKLEQHFDRQLAAHGSYLQTISALQNINCYILPV